MSGNRCQVSSLLVPRRGVDFAVMFVSISPDFATTYIRHKIIVLAPSFITRASLDRTAECVVFDEGCRGEN